MKDFEKKLEALIENGTVEICHEYGEPGYILSEEKKAILFANWNPLYEKDPAFMKWVEENYEPEWSDEWIVDYSTGKAYRTSPDSYSWEQSFRITEDGEMITPDDDISEWIDYTKIDDPAVAHTPRVLPSFIDAADLEAEGFEKLNGDFQDGWYDRHDNPVEIAKRYLEDGYSEVVFSLAGGGVSQFAVDFTCYGRK